MDEPGAPVLAARAGRVGHGEHAAAGLRLVGHERAALLDGRQDEHVGLPHELGEVGHVAAHLDARVVEQRCDDLAVAGDELAADDEAPAALAGAGARPGAQRVVQALARLEAAGEQRGQGPADRAAAPAPGGTGRRPCRSGGRRPSPPARRARRTSRGRTPTGTGSRRRPRTRPPRGAAGARRTCGCGRAAGRCRGARTRGRPRRTRSRCACSAPRAPRGCRARAPRGPCAATRAARRGRRRTRRRAGAAPARRARSW